MYFYAFPPVQYADGAHYVKIGHSPYDPIIASLGTSSQQSPSGAAWPLPPSTEQVHAWYAGSEADTNTAIGREVVDIVAESESFFVDVLSKLLKADFQGGYSTTCVTCKSKSGERLLGEIAPGLIHQTGCNGGGATAALAWGEEVASEVRVALQKLAVSPGRGS